MNSEQTDKNQTPSPWERQRDTLKTLWVVAVLGFWIGILAQGLYYLLRGEANFILLSIISGMGVLGVVLKVRVQRHLHTKPDA